MTVQFSGYVGSDTETLTFKNVIHFHLEEDNDFQWFIRQRVGRSNKSRIMHLPLAEYALDYAHEGMIGD